MDRVVGSVRDFYRARRFGFITRADTGEDVHFTEDAFGQAGLAIFEGQRVSFEVARLPGGRITAVNIERARP